MLAKQGWSSFLEATDASNSSSVWKILLVAQLILKKRCCWRVGDGSSIWVTQDHWIPNYTTNKILHPPLAEEQDWRVSDLINWETHDWDRGFLAVNFQRKDVDLIVRLESIDVALRSLYRSSTRCPTRQLSPFSFFLDSRRFTLTRPDSH